MPKTPYWAASQSWLASLLRRLTCQQSRLALRPSASPFMQKTLLARSLEDYEKRSMHQAVDPEGAYADYFVMCVRTGGPGAKGLFDAPGGAQGMH